VSYQKERDEFVIRMEREGLPLDVTYKLLRAATTLQRYAELACSSEAADRDRVPCPALRCVKCGGKGYARDASDPMGHRLNGTEHRHHYEGGVCLCDMYNGAHETIPRIAVLEYQLTERVKKAVETMKGHGMKGRAADLPSGWTINTQGDLRVIPPSYAERNKGRDRFNLETIGVPSGPTRLRF
jgi:hypothetical protein